MRAEEIQELLSFIAGSGLDEVNIETDKFKLSVKKAGTPAPAPAAYAPAAPVQQAIQASPAVPPAPASVAEAAPAVQAPAANTKVIKSPMIGTFYASSGPDTPKFVNKGDEVKEGQVVCIIEAMKLFNEIESDFSGRIVDILVENATPVEYDQPLFTIAI